MKTTILKISTYFLLCNLILTTANAQQATSRSAYFMENATHSHMMNPALSPYNGYVSLPVLGSFGLGLESNLAFTDFMYPPLTEGGQLMTFMHPDVDAQLFLSKLNPNNYLRAGLQTSLLAFGFYTGDNFWTFDLAAKVKMGMNLPYDFFAFAKNGMSSGSGNEYHIRDLSVDAGAYIEASVGHSRQIFDFLRVGMKLKGLIGAAHVKANISEMDVIMSPSQWSIQTKGSLEGYAKGAAFIKNDTTQAVEDIDFNSPGVGGFGMAVDMGAVYNTPVENLTVSLGIVDLGGISWNKKNALLAKAEGSVSFEGLEGISTDGTASAEEQLENMQNDLMEMIAFKEDLAATENYFQGLNPTFNLGVEYAVLDNKISAGVLYSQRVGNGGYSELMTAINFRPIKQVQLTTSYSFVHGGFETIGFALNLVPYVVNIFLACDYTFLRYTPQFIPLNTATTNVQLGVSIPLGKKKAKEV